MNAPEADEAWNGGLMRRLGTRRPLLPVCAAVVLLAVSTLEEAWG